MITRREFFEELLRGTTGQLELRRMKWNPRKNGKGAYDMLERWFSRDVAELEAFASNGGGDIFHGVNIRDDSGEARKKNICEIVCAEVDIDFKTTPQEQADGLLATSIFEPTFFIGSGNGYHAYWLFDTPIPATEETINLIEAINKGLAQQFLKLLNSPSRCWKISTPNSNGAGRLSMKTEPTELLDLRTIPTQDLQRLIEVCAGRQANRFFEDNFVILSRILLAQHECHEMNEYAEGELAEAAAVFLDLLDRNQSLPADHPARTFLQFNLTAAHDELERRQRQTIMKVVK